ncbi:unnamed protein product [Linum tenue]|uniref:non-specific serine/threonine protein kinase n=1 Tax=Linum tenue TaxID=586396 RepID=A0AAV0GSW9_9ROSI|nr:unnamed protein product [Linum tenue]
MLLTFCSTAQQQQQQDTLTLGQSLTDGQSLVSAGDSFRLGFFRPENSTSRYLGIWYGYRVPTQTIVWVANRGSPISDTRGFLNLTEEGILVLSDGSRDNFPVWSSNVTRRLTTTTSLLRSRPVVAQLLESGNLVVRNSDDEDPDNFLWQSFDHITNTLLPGMKFGRNLTSGLNRMMTSWRSLEDPGEGDFSVLVEMQGYPQAVVRRGPTIQARIGSWNGLRYTGAPTLNPSPTFWFEYEYDEGEEIYFRFRVPNSTVMTRYAISPLGSFQLWMWSRRADNWIVVYSAQGDRCDNYGLCGTYSNCYTYLVRPAGVKLPNTAKTVWDRAMGLEECRRLCLGNCSCTGYSSLDIRNGESGCLMWFDDLIDIRELSDGGQDLYVRVAGSEIVGRSNKKRKTVIVIASVISTMTFLAMMVIALYVRQTKLKKEGMRNEEMELPAFNLSTIVMATNDFSNDNKLGEGGFGPVYMGKLPEGQEIAVKRLSRSSGQGLNEFMNEVILFSKLQHRNLVRLLGCCIHEDEKMLIYEYMSNKSLDFFIFDETQKKLLNWQKRTIIIDGIARGLLYLHQDSRLRIIHRDLKASNVLLDKEMKPKISDFGLAKAFGGDQTEGQTKKVVGTYGYMSPEYAVDGLFSVKSDVFSFGVMVLEIVSGSKNRGFYHSDHDLNLLGHAWTLWSEGVALDLIDDSMKESCNQSEASRCIHVALLCVQQKPDDRPNMSAVVLMLGSENPLPRPNLPGFYLRRNPPEAADPMCSPNSNNQISLTVLEPRTAQQQQRDSLAPGQSLTDGQSIVSSGGSFQLGFFRPENTSSRYLGIWYGVDRVSIQTIVWVANRGSPISDTRGFLNFTREGILVLSDGGRSNNLAVWSSNVTRRVPPATGVVAQLLDSGNLVVRDANDENPDNFLWQSFDFLTNTLLPGMKLGRNLRSGLDRNLMSWRSVEDPGEGEFWVGVEMQGYPQVLVRRGSTIQARIGSWNGLRFTGAPTLNSSPTFSFEYEYDEGEEIYFRFHVPNSTVVSRYVVSPTGLFQLWMWSRRSNDWIVIYSAQGDRCDNYGLCGTYSSCYTYMVPACQCLTGFDPRNPSDWEQSDWEGGCVRRTALACNSSDGFILHSNAKLPNTATAFWNRTMGLEECRRLCLGNCSCTGYSSLDIRNGGSGCLMWFDDLIDIRELSDGGQDLYVRVAGSEIGVVQEQGSSKKRRKMIIVVASVVSSVALLAILVIVFCARERKLKKKDMHTMSQKEHNEEMDLPTFSLSTIVKATNDFAIDNKLGEGGFGPVYMGKLPEGQEIAVKRLSKSSGQGISEFKNEVILFSKLQHRNLVRLLGCCIPGDEKMLIYEYMSNKSLDFVIFDEKQRKLLNWQKRAIIIDGIARGLLYLHQDSRLRIIHRDLKASNILLDSEMQPKISDFGLARTFGRDQTECETNKVVGTFGYMSPEYAVDGLFSVKSDVFSFGVLVLEIVSGRRNRGFAHTDHDLNLLGHSWTLWNEGAALQLIDDSMKESCNQSEVLRCIHVALLCVQQKPDDRPNMSAVVLMLGSENTLPQPKLPGFYLRRNPPEAESSSSNNNNDSYSANQVSLTVMEPR